VLDGFPKNMEQVNALGAANLIPKQVIFLRNGEFFLIQSYIED
jgi:hypothetical protein